MRPAQASIAVIVAAAVAAGCGRTGDPRTTAPTHAASASEPTATGTPRPRPTPTPLPDYVIAVIDVDGGPGYVEVAYGSVWVGNHRGDSITRIDPATNTVATVIPVAGEPTGVTAAFDAIWTFTPLDRQLKRIDPATNAVAATVALDEDGGSITGIVALAGSLWLAGDSGRVLRIDPAAMSVVGSLDLAAGCAGSLTAAAGRLWHAPLCGGSAVTIIDPPGPTVSSTVAVPGANAVWAGLDAVWVSSADGEISKIDPATATVVATGKAGSRAEQLRTGLDALWVRVDGVTLVRMDPATLTITATYALPASPIPGGGIAIADDSVWAVNFGQATVWRIAP